MSHEGDVSLSTLLNTELSAVVERRTTERNWLYRIRQYMENNQWILTPTENVVLALTVVDGLNDEEIAQKLAAFHEPFKKQHVRLTRTKAELELFNLYQTVLEEFFIDGSNDSLSHTLRNIKQDVSLINAYINSNDDEQIGQLVDHRSRYGPNKHLIFLYIDFLGDLYSEKELLSIAQLEKETGYSNHHLRCLIRQGEVTGTHTHTGGWYGSIEGVERYRGRGINVGAPRKPRSW